MEECIFCNILNSNLKYKEQKVNKLLYEDELLAVIPAKGAPIPGWTLVVIKKHLNGFADLSIDELLHVNKIIEHIRSIYFEHFKINSIVLEHGSTSQGRHPQSIVHAHIHIIPFNFKNDIEYELIKTLKLKYIDSFCDITKNKTLDYWLYCDPKGQLYTSSKVTDVPRSIFMNLVAKQIGISLPYEWRNSATDEKFLDELIEIFERFN